MKNEEINDNLTIAKNEFLFNAVYRSPDDE